MKYLYFIANPTPALVLAPAWYYFSLPWLFLLFFVLLKIGITGNMKRRLATIQKTSLGPDLLIAKFRLPNAYRVEQSLHFLFGWCRVRWFGSGKTEWFLALPGVVALIVYAVIQYYG